MPTAVLAVSSCATGPTAERRLGVSLYQLGSAARSLTSAGWEVTVASPRGGDSPLDASTLSEGWIAATTLASNTVPLSRLRPEIVDAWVVLGGYGALYDLIDDPCLKRHLTLALGTGKVVATLDHGSAALAGLIDPAGRSLIAGRRVTGRSDREERQAGHRDISQRSVELALRRAGARYSARAAWQPHMVVDGSLITGQNPRSTPLVAEAVLAAHHPIKIAA